jgi:hypothetical protein
MMDITEPPSVLSDRLVPFAGQLRLAVAVCLARFKGCSRERTGPDLGCYLAWSAEWTWMASVLGYGRHGRPGIAGDALTGQVGR